MNVLEKAIYNLLKTEPYFAHFILNCQIQYNVKGVETAGICIRNHTLSLAINTDFFETLTVVEQQAVLKHEIMHAVLEHCGSRVDKTTWNRNRTNINIAMDCAINQYIAGLPKNAITLESLSEKTERVLAPFETWEYYYSHIRDFVKQNPDKCAPGEPNDHGYMLEGDDSVSPEEAKAILKDTMSKADKAAAGNIPNSISSILGRLNEAAEVNWKQQLRNIVASVRSRESKNTRMRPNRRFDLDQPGKKRIKTLILGVCCDSSGSVSDDQYGMFMREVKTLANSTAITYLVQADCAVSKVDVIKGGVAKSSVLDTRHGGGGTAYQPAIDYCMKQGCDAIIYFGDFDCADTPVDPGIPFVWVGVGDSPAPGAFGMVLRLKG